ncbi:MAG TPA: hypothetical protein VGY54_01370, partial [Polyangiaceae bacterium]|nr:hypothetical protein [Polyangiaceae bacterium]
MSARGPTPDRTLATGFADFVPDGWLGAVPVDLSTKLRFVLGDETELAKTLMWVVRKLFKREHVAYDEGGMYAYNPINGLWEKLAVEFLQHIVARFSGASLVHQTDDGEDIESPIKISAHTVAGTLKMAATLEAKNGLFRFARKGIAFADTFVEVTAEGFRELPHSHEHRARRGFDFPIFGAGVRAPLYDNFMAEIFRD